MNDITDRLSGGLSAALLVARAVKESGCVANAGLGAGMSLLRAVNEASAQIPPDSIAWHDGFVEALENYLISGDVGQWAIDALDRLRR